MFHLVSLQVAPTLDPWELILGAGIVVKLVLLVLLLMSLGCWFISGAKLVRVLQARGQSVRFLDLFWRDGHAAWSPERLESIYSQLKPVEASPLAKVFHAGYVELARMQNAEAAVPGRAGAPDLDNVQRALRRASVAEMTRLEAALPFLATTASTAPFIGLFGTVWGIMGAFATIGVNRSASLEVVAPHIAEALIATAIGLLAAIPAVMAYNYFVRRIRVLESEIDAFSSDYLNVVERHFL